MVQIPAGAHAGRVISSEMHAPAPSIAMPCAPVTMPVAPVADHQVPKMTIDSVLLAAAYCGRRCASDREESRGSRRSRAPASPFAPAPTKGMDRDWGKWRGRSTEDGFMAKSKGTKGSKGTKATKKSVAPAKTQKKHSAELSDDDLKQVSGGSFSFGASQEKWIEAVSPLASPLKIE
jgi:hypothetical protein